MKFVQIGDNRILINKIESYYLDFEGDIVVSLIGNQDICIEFKKKKSTLALKALDDYFFTGVTSNVIDKDSKKYILRFSET